MQCVCCITYKQAQLSVSLIDINIMFLCTFYTAECSPPCENDGSCVAPNTCSCGTGWTGDLCGEGMCIRHQLRLHEDYIVN